jgi:hypothetical protein
MAPTLTYPPKPQRGDAIAVLSPSWGGPAPLACRRASAGQYHEGEDLAHLRRVVQHRHHDHVHGRADSCRSLGCNPLGASVNSVLGALDEFQRELIVEGTNEGLACPSQLAAREAEVVPPDRTPRSSPVARAWRDRRDVTCAFASRNAGTAL